MEVIGLFTAIPILGPKLLIPVFSIGARFAKNSILRVFGRDELILAGEEDAALAAAVAEAEADAGADAVEEPLGLFDASIFSPLQALISCSR